MRAVSGRGVGWAPTGRTYNYKPTAPDQTVADAAVPKTFETFVPVVPPESRPYAETEGFLLPAMKHLHRAVNGGGGDVALLTEYLIEDYRQGKGYGNILLAERWASNFQPLLNVMAGMTPSTDAQAERLAAHIEQYLGHILASPIVPDKLKKQVCESKRPCGGRLRENWRSAVRMALDLQNPVAAGAIVVQMLRAQVSPQVKAEMVKDMGAYLEEVHAALLQCPLAACRQMADAIHASAVQLGLWDEQRVQSQPWREPRPSLFDSYLTPADEAAAKDDGPDEPFEVSVNRLRGKGILKGGESSRTVRLHEPGRHARPDGEGKRAEVRIDEPAPPRHVKVHGAPADLRRLLTR